jgi:TonB family protein
MRLSRSNQPPQAALKLDSIDETSRTVCVSDAGSLDGDGRVVQWMVDWGDGKKDTLTSAPAKKTHVYAAAGAFTVAMRCADDKGATGQIMATIPVRLAGAEKLAAKQEADKAKEEAKRVQQAADEARQAAEQAKQEAEKAREDARRSKELADKAAADINSYRQAADQASAEARRQKEAADKAAEEARRYKQAADDANKAAEDAKRAAEEAKKAAQAAEQKALAKAPVPAPTVAEGGGTAGFLGEKPQGDFPAPPFKPNILSSGQSAYVEVQVQVGPGGRVKGTKVLKASSKPPFDRHVEDHIKRKFKFTPAAAGNTYVYQCEQRVK